MTQTYIFDQMTEQNLIHFITPEQNSTPLLYSAQCFVTNQTGAREGNNYKSKLKLCCFVAEEDWVRASLWEAKIERA